MSNRSKFIRDVSWSPEIHSFTGYKDYNGHDHKSFALQITATGETPPVRNMAVIGWTSGQAKDQKSTFKTLLRTGFSINTSFFYFFSPEKVFLPVVAVIASCFYTAIALTYYVELL